MSSNDTSGKSNPLPYFCKPTNVEADDHDEDLQADCIFANVGEREPVIEQAEEVFPKSLRQTLSNIHPEIAQEFHFLDSKYSSSTMNLWSSYYRIPLDERNTYTNALGIAATVKASIPGIFKIFDEQLTCEHLNNDTHSLSFVSILSQIFVETCNPYRSTPLSWVTNLTLDGWIAFETGSRVSGTIPTKYRSQSSFVKQQFLSNDGDKRLPFSMDDLRYVRQLKESDDAPKLYEVSYPPAQAMFNGQIEVSPNVIKAILAFVEINELAITFLCLFLKWHTKQGCSWSQKVLDHINFLQAQNIELSSDPYSAPTPYSLFLMGFPSIYKSFGAGQAMQLILDHFQHQNYLCIDKVAMLVNYRASEGLGLMDILTQLIQIRDQGRSLACPPTPDGPHPMFEDQHFIYMFMNVLRSLSVTHFEELQMNKIKETFLVPYKNSPSSFTLSNIDVSIRKLQSSGYCNSIHPAPANESFNADQIYGVVQSGRDSYRGGGSRGEGGGSVVVSLADSGKDSKGGKGSKDRSVASGTKNISSWPTYEVPLYGSKGGKGGKGGKDGGKSHSETPILIKNIRTLPIYEVNYGSKVGKGSGKGHSETPNSTKKTLTLPTYEEASTMVLDIFDSPYLMDYRTLAERQQLRETCLQSIFYDQKPCARFITLCEDGIPRSARFPSDIYGKLSKVQYDAVHDLIACSKVQILKDGTILAHRQNPIPDIVDCPVVGQLRILEEFTPRALQVNKQRATQYSATTSQAEVIQDPESEFERFSRVDNHEPATILSFQPFVLRTAPRTFTGTAPF
jgi:hypothetical protein